MPDCNRLFQFCQTNIFFTLCHCYHFHGVGSGPSSCWYSVLKHIVIMAITAIDSWLSVAHRLCLSEWRGHYPECPRSPSIHRLRWCPPSPHTSSFSLCSYSSDSSSIKRHQRRTLLRPVYKDPPFVLYLLEDSKLWQRNSLPYLY